MVPVDLDQAAAARRTHHSPELRGEFGTVVALTRHVRGVLERTAESGGAPDDAAASLLDTLLLFGGTRRPGAWRVEVGPRGTRVYRGAFPFPWKRACHGAIMGRDVSTRRVADQRWSAAWRREVADQVGAFRAAGGAAGVGMEVDHDPGPQGDGRFVRLVDRFIEANPGVDTRSRNVRLVDRGVAERWRAFHEATASLRFVTPDANKRGNRGWRKYPRPGNKRERVEKE